MQIIILLFLSFSLFAQDKTLVEKVLQGEVQPKVEDCPPENTKKACLEAICGKSSERMSYVDIYNDLANSQKKYPELDEYEKLLKSKINEDLVAERDKLKILKEVVNENTEISPDYYPFLNGLRNIIYGGVVMSCEGCFEIVKIDEANATMDIKFKSEKSENELKKLLNKEDVKDDLKKIQLVFESAIYKKYFFAKYAGWPLFISIEKKQQNFTSYIESIIADADKVRARISKEMPRFPLSKSYPFNEKILRRIRSNDFSESDLESFFDNYYNAKVFELILSDSNDLNKKTIKVSDWFNLEVMKERLKKYEKDLNELKQDELIANNLNHCMVILKNNLETLPSEDELKKKKQVIDGQKEEFKNKFFALLSSHSASVLKPKFDEIIISYPKSRTDFITILKDEILDVDQEEFSSESLEKFNLNTMEKVKEFSRQMSVLSLFNLKVENNIEEFKNSFSSSCDELAIDGLSDHSVPLAGGKVQVSSFSLKSPQDQKGIFFHELAHATSHLIKNTNLSQKSMEKYISVSQCVSKGLPEVNKQNNLLKFTDGNGINLLRQLETTQYTEENWADLVAGTLLNESDTNFACFLQSKEKNEYKNFDVYPKEGDLDPHAPDFYRALAIHQMKNGSLPGPCQKSLSAQEIKDTKKECGLKGTEEVIKK